MADVPLSSWAPFQDLPIDMLHPILAHLEDRRDFHSCVLVNKTFCRLATPFLYRKLDSRIISKTFVYHPSSTLLNRPDLARYVRHVTETGAVHRQMLLRYPDITRDTLAALALCTNLQSMTWIDDSVSIGTTLLAFIDVVRKLPLRELTIRTHSDLGETVWSQLVTLTGLQKVSIWCMEGPPRVLQGWSGPLGNTLTHLELGVSAFLYPCSELISQLPLLRDLRLKGAPATSIPTILTYLPNLQSLDTEYLLSGSGAFYSPRRPIAPPRSAHASDYSDDSCSDDDTAEPPPPFPVLKQLTVRTSSMDNLGPQKLWGWIRELVPHPGLETFNLNAYTFNSDSPGIPRMFILDLAVQHGRTLKHFMVGDSSYLTLNDIQCLCSKFPKLETLACSVAKTDVASITEAIAGAKNLQTMKLQVGLRRAMSFTLEDATSMMLRDEDSKLRVIAINHTQYSGKWTLIGEEDKEEQQLKFVVSADISGHHWRT